MATQLQLLPVPGGDAAINALGVGDSDQGAVMTIQEFLGKKWQVIKPFFLGALIHGAPLVATFGGIPLLL